jgi:hypothetical protein
LKAQPANTATTPYNVRLNISDLGGSYNTAGSLGKALRDNFNYYVNLDFWQYVTSIGENAFYGCFNLTGITIPKGVISIENKAFDGCTSLRNITIKTDKVTNTYSNNWLTRFPATDLVVTFEDVTSIKDYAFFTNANSGFSNPDTTRLTSVTISDSVTSIGNYAFGGCTSHTSVTIPDSVNSIGEAAFSE